jgi:hypothetical protein
MHSLSDAKPKIIFLVQPFASLSLFLRVPAFLPFFRSIMASSQRPLKAEFMCASAVQRRQTARTFVTRTAVSHLEGESGRRIWGGLQGDHTAQDSQHYTWQAEPKRRIHSAFDYNTAGRKHSALQGRISPSADDRHLHLESERESEKRKEDGKGKTTKWKSETFKLRMAKSEG